MRSVLRAGKLLCKYHVNTDEDLSLLMENIEAKMTDLLADRNDMRNRARRDLPESEKTAAREKAMDLTTEIRELRRELKVCGQVQERSAHVRENLEIIDRDRQREKER